MLTPPPPNTHTHTHTHTRLPPPPTHTHTLPLPLPPPPPSPPPRASVRFDDDAVTRAKWQNLFLDTVYEVCSNKQAQVGHNCWLMDTADLYFHQYLPDIFCTIMI